MLSIRMCVYVSGVQVLPRKSQTPIDELCVFTESCQNSKPKILNN